MRVLALIAGALISASLATAAPARAPKLAADARVSSLEFRFVGRHVLTAADFENLIATSAPGNLDRLTVATAWIPFVPEPTPHPFVPILLQQDVERVRRTLRRKGFSSGDADYQVEVSPNRRDVHVVFVIREGEPTVLRSLALVDGSVSPPVPLPDSLEQACSDVWSRLRKHQLGQRLSDESLEEARAALVGALGNAGYPAARLENAVTLDSTSRQANVVWSLVSGPHARISSLAIEGLHAVPEPLVTRQVGLVPGQWYSRKAIDQSRLQLQSVPLFQRSEILLGRSVSADSGVGVRVLIQESRARLTNVEAGYVTDGAGVTGQVRWTDPNLTGGGRSFDAVGLVQTGWWATSGDEDRLLRATLTLTQPYVASPRLSLSAGPAIERRDGRIDRSVSSSLIATLVYRISALQSAALRYDYTYRRLDELKVPGLVSAAIDTLGGFGGLSEALLDSIKTPDRIPQLVFFTSLGQLDDISRPRHGIVIKPNLSVTILPAWGTVNFGKADVQVTFFAPIPGSTNALMVRSSIGGLWPFGASVPSQSSGAAVEWYRLRDQLLKAGGATDVRGYASELLGPKYPVIETNVSGVDTVLSSSRYSSLGGMRRMTASAELRIALPRFGRAVYGHVFADAGRVWTTDERYKLGGIFTSDEERVFYTTGGGIGYYTPVGAIRFDLGYKLNPSLFDVRHSGDVLQALVAGQAASSAPVDSRLRYAIHLSLGLFF